MKIGLTLETNHDLNYFLIAIRSSLDDYHFAYFLNKSPLFLLKRLNNDLCCLIDNSSVYFSTFESINLELERTIFLIKNKALYNPITKHQQPLFGDEVINNTAFLLPELKEFDYFLKLIGIWKDCEVLELRKYLKQIKDVESETLINPNQIKSINNLIL